MVLREGLVLAAAGIAIGLLAALGSTRYLQALLFAIKPTDTLVYIFVSVVLGAAALAGCYLPARRATRVDPAVVLRRDLVIPVDPISGNRAMAGNGTGLRRSIEHLQAGGMLVVFPAGEVSHFRRSHRGERPRALIF